MQENAKVILAQRRARQCKYKQYLQRRDYAGSSAKDWSVRIHEIDKFCIDKCLLTSSESLYDCKLEKCLLIVSILINQYYDEIRRPHKRGLIAALKHYCEFLRGLAPHEDATLALERSELRHLLTHLVWKRDLNIRAKALRRSCYKCELDNRHRTFSSRFSSHPYVEVHHLIPLHYQSDSRFLRRKLDCISNLVVLCPNCHRLLHYGSSNEVKKALERLYALRKGPLGRCGVSIRDLEQIYLKGER